MARRILPWLSWLLAEGTLVWLQVGLWPYGGLWLLLVWTAVLLLYRAAVSQMSHRAFRLVGDLVFAGLCALAVFEGGWYLLPAVVLFAVGDAAGVAASLPSLPGGREGHELGAALGSTVVGWLALAFFLSGPLYGSASSTIGPNGTTVNSGPTQESLLQVGLTPEAAVVLAACVVLFGLVTVLALVHIKTGRRGAWWLLVAVAIGLLVLVVLGAWTVGLWLVPGAALALLAVRFGRPGQVTASGA
jgi:hypothetical protein